MRWLIVLVVACGPKVLDPAEPRVTCRSCPDGVLVYATHAKLRLATSWHATCEARGNWDEEPTDPCNFVEHDVELVCNGCVTRRVEPGEVEITLPDPGRVDIDARFISKQGGERRVGGVRVEVRRPTRVEAECAKSGDVDWITITTFANEQRLLAAPLDVAVVGGGRCTAHMVDMMSPVKPTVGFSCKLDGARELEISTPDFSTHVIVGC